MVKNVVVYRIDVIFFSVSRYFCRSLIKVKFRLH